MATVKPITSTAKLRDLLDRDHTLNGGVLFGIRVGHLPFNEVLADSTAREALREALDSMAEDAADYKGLTNVRPQIFRWLADPVT